ncbi:hypothetical protein [Spiroplasma endosymbiont of Nebria brevicollis]|uniref:hypothetical protein n=1 Tax=Spiroplasma endosymbiont of Nebria brevicollis TaxID=3066284 RepID=UPI00313F263A
MNWWTVVLIISGVWALIGFITVIIILKLKKVKPIVQKVINYHLKILLQNTVVTKSSNYNYHLVKKGKNIEDALLFLQFKYEVAVLNQNNQQMINWIADINYCYLFNHNHHRFTVTNILNHGIKHHINILKPLHCLKKLFDKCHNKMNNDKPCQKPKNQKTATNGLNNHYQHNFNENAINNFASTVNYQTQNIHHNAM